MVIYVVFCKDTRARDEVVSWKSLCPTPYTDEFVTVSW